VLVKSDLFLFCLHGKLVMRSFRRKLRKMFRYPLIACFCIIRLFFYTREVLLGV